MQWKLYKLTLIFCCNIIRCMGEERLLTTKEAAEILGVHQSRIYALVNSGRLKAKRFSNVLIIKESDLEPVRERKPGRPSKKKE